MRGIVSVNRKRDPLASTYEQSIIDHYANGKVVEGWGSYDLLGLMQQLGVIPAPRQAS